MRTITVNGNEVDAVLLKIEYGYREVINYEDWLRNSPSPLFYGQEEHYSVATISLLVEGSDIGELETKCSSIVNSFKKGLVKDSGVSFYLDGFLTNVSEERITGKARILNIEFQGIKQEEEEQINHTFSQLNEVWEFTIKGNTETPCIIYITADMGYTVLELQLNGESFKIDNITKGDLIVLDSQAAAVQINGENGIDSYESWSFPTLQATNSLSIVSGTPTISIKYNGRWT